MSSKGNQRLKRKNLFSDTKIEPNMKALKKEDIIAQLMPLRLNLIFLKEKYWLREEKYKLREK